MILILGHIICINRVKEIFHSHFKVSFGCLNNISLINIRNMYDV